MAGPRARCLLLTAALLAGTALHAQDSRTQDFGTPLRARDAQSQPQPQSQPSFLPPPGPAPASGEAPPPADDEQVSFAADALDYDDQADIVTASGQVRMLRAGSRLRADKVVWNRATGEVHAMGNVAIVNPGGDTAYGDDVRLRDDMKNGVTENMLIVLADGGRLAARRGTRQGAITTLDHAAYTPCRVADGSGCAHEPSWKITALRIVHDQDKHRIYYKDAKVALFGHPILWLPSLSHPDGHSDGGGGNGLLLPNVQYSRVTGLEYAQPYYFQLAPNRDATVTPHFYTGLLPAIEGLYRSLDSRGAYQVRGEVTYGSRLPATLDTTGVDKDRGLRGFVDAQATYQLGPYWTLHGQLRLETDRTFMKRYDISNDDRLRSVLQAERIDRDSYLSIAGWFVQTVRLNDRQGQQPIALPAIDYRRRIADPWLGGVFQLQANTLALLRTAGQDTQRAFVGARWDKRLLTPLGQELTLTAYSRADVYHTSDTEATSTLIYRGEDGWRGRGVAALAADVRWPFIGEFAGGTQQIAPRVQVVATPHTRNLALPNEDSRAVDLEDTNLFAISRFAGYDRWEDSSRVTYGVEYAYQRPKLEVRSTIGQSYRLNAAPSILPSGTGLSDRFSDYVGRVTVKYGSWLEVTDRFRLDKDSAALRRHEVDMTIGGRRTYALVGYLKLNRNIDTSIEDLRDLEELRLGGRIQLLRYWSLFGSGVFNLTTKKQNPQSITDGFTQIRSRVGLTYEDDCLALGLQWRKDNDPINGARRGSTFSLRFALKNVGR